MLAAGDLIGGLVRGAQMAATMSVFGSMLFRSWILGPFAPVAADARDVIEHRLRSVILVSLGAALATAIAWLVTQSVAMTDAAALAQVLDQLPVVLLHSHFGLLLMARVVLLIAGCIAFTMSWHGGRLLGLVAATIAVLLQIGLGHGLSMGGSEGALLLGMEALHVLAAGIWLGGLLPLLLALTTLPQDVAYSTVRRFSRLAMICVGALILTIIVQSWMLIGGIAGLIGTDYGRLCLVKAGLLALLLSFAAWNKWRLTPALNVSPGGTARQYLRISIALETLAGFAVVLAAGTLLTLEPAIHRQPFWPFSWQLSLVAAEDPDLRAEILLGAGQIVGALASLSLAIWWRRVRWLSVAMAALLGWWSTTHLNLLLVPAYPTSFYISPTGFTAASIANGAQLFPTYCISCHGIAGRGDGPQAANMMIKPADLTAAHLFAHSDGELFWWLTSGIQGPNDALVMPGFADQLDEDDRWNLIDYIRAHNAGLTQREYGKWPQPMPAPDITVTVAGKQVPLSSLKGSILRLIAPTPNTARPSPLLGKVTPPAKTVEIEAGSDAWTAYAVIAGVAPDELTGTAFLVDRAGWLRTIFRPDVQAGWTDTAAFAAAAQRADADPIQSQVSGHHHH